MASKTQLCNQALTRLGAARIISLTDDTESARLCNIIFEEVAKEVMSLGAFTSTLFRQTLAQTTNTPAFGYTYEYQLPTNPKALRIINVSETKAGSVNYVIESDKLLTNETSVKVRYIGYLTDSQDYDPMLQRAIVAKLTAELAYSLTGKVNLVQYWESKYKQELQESRTVNGLQGSDDIVISDDLIDVR